MTAAKPGYSGNLTSTLARDNALQVRTKGGDWTFVRGLSQLSPTFAGEMQDDSDIDGEGYASNISTGQTFTITLEGLRKGEGTGEDFTEDPGQAILRQAGNSTGFDNILEARTWRTDGTGEAYEANFSVEYATQPGDRVSLDKFSATLTSRGKPQRIEIVTDAEAESVPFGTDPEDGED